MDVVDFDLRAGVCIETHARLQLPQLLILQFQRHLEGAVEESSLLGEYNLAAISRFHTLIKHHLNFYLIILSECPALSQPNSYHVVNSIVALVFVVV